MSDSYTYPDDADKAMQMFLRKTHAKDELLLQIRLAAEAAKGPQLVKYSQVKLVPKIIETEEEDIAPSRYIPVDDNSACHCTLDELWKIWRDYSHPDGINIIQEYQQFPTTIPAGYLACRACLRFAKVNGTNITALNGELSTAVQNALLGLNKSGCFAIAFRGYKVPHVYGKEARDFHGSMVDFTIYLLICPH